MPSKLNVALLPSENIIPILKQDIRFLINKLEEPCLLKVHKFIIELMVAKLEEVEKSGNIKQWRKNY